MQCAKTSDWRRIWLVFVSLGVAIDDWVVHMGDDLCLKGHSAVEYHCTASLLA